MSTVRRQRVGRRDLAGDDGVGATVRRSVKSRHDRPEQTLIALQTTIRHDLHSPHRAVLHIRKNIHVNIKHEIQTQRRDMRLRVNQGECRVHAPPSDCVVKAVITIAIRLRSDYML